MTSENTGVVSAPPRKMFQSCRLAGGYGRRVLTKVGMGLTPSPLLTPLMAVKVVLLGAIHVIQEKYERAWKMKFGNQKSAISLAKRQPKTYRRT